MNTLEYVTMRAKNSQPTPGQRNTYTTDAIKAVILSYPEGAYINSKELALVCGDYFKAAGAIQHKLDSMVKEGEIVKAGKRGNGRYSYRVLKQINDYSAEIKAYEEKQRIPYKFDSEHFTPNPDLFTPNNTPKALTVELPPASVNDVLPTTITPEDTRRAVRPVEEDWDEDRDIYEDDDFTELKDALESERLWTIKQLEDIAMRLEFYTEGPKLRASELLMHLKELNNG